jgi:hypothetical protein
MFERLSTDIISSAFAPPPAANPTTLKMNGHVTTVEVKGPEREQSEIPVIPQLRGGRVDNYKVSDLPLGTIKPVRIIAIGAGASGINIAHAVKNYLKNATLIVYEKNEGE